MVLGLFERDGDYISGAEDSATFDGKTLGEFLRSDYDYFEGNNSGRGGGSSGRDPEDLFVASLLGGGPRSRFFAPLRNAGIDTQDYQFYADKAGIKNVNSRNDLDQIITAFNEDRRQAMEMPQEMKSEMVPQQSATVPMAGKYLGFF